MSEFSMNIHFNCICETLENPCTYFAKNKQLADKSNNCKDMEHKISKQITDDSNINIPKQMQDKIFDCKSASVYENWHKKFKEFIEQEDLPENFESILKYFTDISSKYSPSTLWQAYSCLNKFYTTYKNWNNFNQTSALKNYIKKIENTSKPKKQSTILEKEQLFNFLENAPNDDKQVLVRKAVSIVGYYGGLRCAELTNLKWKDVSVQNDVITVFIADSKTDQNGSKRFCFNIPKSSNSCCPYSILKLYLDDIKCSMGKCDRLFQNPHIKSKAFSGQPMGRNTIGSIPKYIATFLELENPGSYTGHCFRRSSATALADTGASSVTLKRQFRWKSDTVCQSYIDQSKKIKLDVAKSLSLPSTSENASNPARESKIIQISNCSNLIINL